MSGTAHIAIGEMYARLVAAETEIFFVITMREDRVFADGAMHNARIMTKCESFSDAHDIAPKRLAARRCQQTAFSSSNPVR